MPYRVAFTKSFQREYRALPQKVRKKARNQIARLQEGDFQHPSLRAKKLSGVKPEVWEASLTMNYRMTFHIEGDLLVFRAIGTHDVLGRP